MSGGGIAYYDDGTVRILHGDARRQMATLDAASIEAVVCDPPYGLSREPDVAEVLRHWLAGDDYQHSGGGFMGRTWDSFVPGPSVWREAFRVLKPGGWLLAFGGTRTHDLLSIAIRMAGFEMRDNIAEFGPNYGPLAWITGQGFPKSKACLKPSHEPVVIGRKPQDMPGIMVEIGSHLDRLESEWRARLEDPTIPTGRVAGSPVQTATSNSESTAETCWSTVTSWRRSWADLCDLTSTSTIETTSSTTTDLRILSSCLSQITLASIIQAQTQASGPRSLVTAAANLFAAALTRSYATLALSTAESATGGMHTGLQGGIAQASSSGYEPILLARKPGSSVLQIDASRLPGAWTTWRRSDGSIAEGGKVAFNPTTTHQRNPEHSSGRWPPNVVLTHSEGCQPVGVRKVRPSGGPLDRSTIQAENKLYGAAPKERTGTYDRVETVEAWECEPDCPVALLDQQSGILSTHGTDSGGYERANKTDWRFRKGAQVGDQGGASRFFYTAKAGPAERITVDGERHPTVKPLALMRWLVRLVTPPGGTVLDPFCGSGSTLVAAAMEGFRAVGIEADERWCRGSAKRVAELPPVQETLAL